MWLAHSGVSKPVNQTLAPDGNGTAAFIVSGTRSAARWEVYQHMTLVAYGNGNPPMISTQCAQRWPE